MPTAICEVVQGTMERFGGRCFDLLNDILHFMLAKIAHHLFKLGCSASLELSQMVTVVTRNDFETTIRLGIDDWLACAIAYFLRATAAYGGSQENLSIMLPTLFELWVAINKIIIGQISLLAEYSPKIPLTF
ncbi:hypothetical protein BDR04DRAFT_1115626 [Suillus decipiens]|nr:hypothetical protein BDR04DRAFT_1115626 [Suillus decipiens]